jgi:tetratricopeptide (TPR) repeat protein
VRAETRHQLKTDRFSQVTLEAAGNAAHWTAEHQAKLIAAVIAVVVIAAIAFGGWYYVNTQDEKASAELSTAVRTFETPVRPPGVPAQPGYDSFASSQERAMAARKQFQDIVDKYPRTHTADMARYFVGLASSQLGDNAAAERSLQEAAGSRNADLAALGKFALAAVYRGENKDAQAIDLYKQLIDKPTIVVSKATAQLELAGFYESRQKLDDAKKIYAQVEKENPSSEAGSLAQRRTAALKQ